MKARILAFLGAAIVATLLGLMATYKEYQPAVDTLISVVSALGSFLAIYEFFRNK